MWVIGVLLEVLATLCGTIGKQLIRFSSMKGEDLASEEPAQGGSDAAPKPPASDVPTETTKQPEELPKRAWAFYTGLVVNVAVGPALEMAAYSFAAQSLLAPFGGLDTVWNAILAPFTLGERLTWRRLFGIGVIVIGTALSAIFGSHNEKDWTVDGLKEVLVTVRTLIYICAFVVWFMTLYYVRGHNPAGSLPRGISIGLMGGSLAGNMFFVKVRHVIYRKLAGLMRKNPYGHE